MARSHPAKQAGHWSVGHISFMAVLAVAPLQGGPVPGSACEVREISREWLSAPDGNPIHIEAVEVVANRAGDLLIAGERNYIFRREPSGQWGYSHTDSILGVIVGKGKGPVLIHSPIPTREIAGVRAAPRGEASWDVVLAQTAAYEGPSRPFTAERLWHATIEHRRLAQAERIPIPQGGVVTTEQASALVRHGDTLSWALPIELDGGKRGVVLLRKADGLWTFQVLSTGWVSYIDLTHSPETGLALAMVRADTTQERDRNSLFLLTQREGWRSWRKLVAGIVEDVYEPRFSRDGSIISWETPKGGLTPRSNRQRAIFHPLDGGPVQPVTVDPSIGGQQLAPPLQITAHRYLWLLTSSSAEQELHVATADSDTTAILAKIKSPFFTRPSSALIRGNELLIVGAAMKEESHLPVSLLFRLEVTCSQTSPGPERWRQSRRSRRWNGADTSTAIATRGTTPRGLAFAQDSLAAREDLGPRRARIPVTVALVDTALTGSLPAVLIHRREEPHDILLLHTPEATPQLLSETLNGVRVVRSVVGEGQETDLVLSPRFTKRQPLMGGAEDVLNRLRASAPTDLVSVGSVRQIVVYIDDVGWKH